ncbi:hypothetical protein ACFL59_04730 [Planctomycetota bacterium]
MRRFVMVGALPTYDLMDSESQAWLRERVGKKGRCTSYQDRFWLALYTALNPEAATSKAEELASALRERFGDRTKVAWSPVGMGFFVSKQCIRGIEPPPGPLAGLIESLEESPEADSTEPGQKPQRKQRESMTLLLREIAIERGTESDESLLAIAPKPAVKKRDEPGGDQRPRGRLTAVFKDLAQQRKEEREKLEARRHVLEAAVGTEHVKKQPDKETHEDDAQKAARVIIAASIPPDQLKQAGVRKWLKLLLGKRGREHYEGDRFWIAFKASLGGWEAAAGWAKLVLRSLDDRFKGAAQADWSLVNSGFAQYKEALRGQRTVPEPLRSIMHGLRTVVGVEAVSDAPEAVGSGEEPSEPESPGQPAPTVDKDTAPDDEKVAQPEKADRIEEPQEREAAKPKTSRGTGRLRTGARTFSRAHLKKVLVADSPGKAPEASKEEAPGKAPDASKEEAPGKGPEASKEEASGSRDRSAAEAAGEAAPATGKAPPATGRASPVARRAAVLLVAKLPPAVLKRQDTRAWLASLARDSGGRGTYYRDRYWLALKIVSQGKAAAREDANRWKQALEGRYESQVMVRWAQVRGGFTLSNRCLKGAEPLPEPLCSMIESMQST